MLPFFHAYGLTVILMNMGLAGATVVTMPRFDLEQFLRCTRSTASPRSFVAPPIVLVAGQTRFVDQPRPVVAHADHLSGAAPLSADVADEAAARIGCE